MRRMKQFAALGLVIALSAGSVIGASAADTKESDATITMTADGDTEEPTGPVDPWNPDPNEILEPDPDDGDTDDEEEVTGNKGRVRIDYISNFKFPDTEINTVDQTVYAAIKNMNILDEDDGTVKGSKKVPNYAQISDYRGSGAGWTLKAKIGNFEYKDGSDTYVLKGAQVTLNNINTSNQTTASPYITNFEKAAQITLSSSDKVIMSGTGDPSKGTNMAYFGSRNDEAEAEESVELFIPADDGTTLAQTYKAKLTWTLEDTPTP